MVEEIRSERAKLKNLIDCKSEVNVTSCKFMKELKNTLKDKYKSDSRSVLQLHQLELLFHLIEGKNIMDDTITIKPVDIDDWNDMMHLSKIYNVLENPSSEMLKWERRIEKKKDIGTFKIKDFIEWQATQRLKLKQLQNLAENRKLARNLEERLACGPENSRNVWHKLMDLKELCDKPDREEMKKKGLSTRQKLMQPKRLFKFRDDCSDDWRESYSDESEETEDESDFITSESDIIAGVERSEKFQDMSTTLDETLIEKPQLFAPYSAYQKYKLPIFEEMDITNPIVDWLRLYKEASSKFADADESQPENQLEVQDTLRPPDRTPIAEISEAEEEDLEDKNASAVGRSIGAPIAEISEVDEEAYLENEEAPAVGTREPIAEICKTDEEDLEDKKAPEVEHGQKLVETRDISESAKEKDATEHLESETPDEEGSTGTLGQAESTTSEIIQSYEGSEAGRSILENDSTIFSTDESVAEIGDSTED